MTSAQYLRDVLGFDLSAPTRTGVTVRRLQCARPCPRQILRGLRIMTGEMSWIKPQQIDYPRYGHIGRKIKFAELPPDCQRLVLGDYLYLWDLPGARAD